MRILKIANAVRLLMRSRISRCRNGYAGELCDLCVDGVQICDADEPNPDQTGG